MTAAAAYLITGCVTTTLTVMTGLTNITATVRTGMMAPMTHHHFTARRAYVCSICITLEPTNCRYSQCPDGYRCISEEQWCNGMEDCRNGTDEMDCPCELLDMFACGEYNGTDASPKCVYWDVLCDSVPNCSDGSDEWQCDELCDANYTK